jgi:hypothetical protein
MPTDADDRAARSTSGAAAWVVAVVLLFTLLLILAIVFRSVWWSEAGSPLPRGTERRLPVPHAESGEAARDVCGLDASPSFASAALIWS